MKANNTVCNGKAYPGTLKRIFSMKPMEWPKHLPSIFLVEPHTVVPDVINDLTILLGCSEFYAGVVGFRCELPRHFRAGSIDRR